MPTLTQVTPRLPVNDRQPSTSRSSPGCRSNGGRRSTPTAAVSSRLEIPTGTWSSSPSRRPTRNEGEIAVVRSTFIPRGRELSPTVSPEGRYFFFHRDGVIHQIDLSAAIAPSRVRPGVSAMLASGLCFFRKGPSSTLLLRAAMGEAPDTPGAYHDRHGAVSNHHRDRKPGPAWEPPSSSRVITAAA